MIDSIPVVDLIVIVFVEPAVRERVDVIVLVEAGTLMTWDVVFVELLSLMVLDFDEVLENTIDTIYFELVVLAYIDSKVVVVLQRVRICLTRSDPPLTHLMIRTNW